MWVIHVLLCLLAFAIPYKETSQIEWQDKSPQVMSGCAAYYSKGLMESTAVTFGHIASSQEYNEWLEDNGYLGAVAVYRLGDKGKDVHILWPDGTLDGPYLAIDVVARHHYELGLRRNRVIDVDYETAMRYEMKGPVAVTIIYNHSNMLEYLYRGDNVATTGVTTEKYKGCVGK